MQLKICNSRQWLDMCRFAFISINTFTSIAFLFLPPIKENISNSYPMLFLNQFVNIYAVFDFVHSCAITFILSLWFIICTKRRWDKTVSVQNERTYKSDDVVMPYIVILWKLGVHWLIRVCYFIFCWFFPDKMDVNK